MNPETAAATGRVPHGGSDDETLIDFSANVNPECPSDTVSVYESAFETARRYPDDGYGEFRRAAADSLDCDPERIVPTAGGLEAIRLAIGTTVDAGDSVLVPAPSFGEYAREVRLQGATPDFVAQDGVLDADPAGRALAIVCNPNNPTGDAYDHDELRAFAERCRAAGTTLLVDEAFLGFTDRPSMAGTDGVVVARSLTKLYGLPGLRAGFAAATGDELGRLENARRAWTLGAPAAAVGAHCLRQSAFAETTRRRVDRERERMRETLDDEYDVRPSDAPFLLVDVGDCDVDVLVARLRERGIAVRDATTFRGLDSHVRVAVRTSAENDRLLEAMTDV
ncbi:threonine-phosphate decarboxylase CobD [Halostella sp. PRR32]|uniref:threonine-phosphate decarboxylase CobD n=1 Tax=Halostella sp. PRR32 TaxID=3098147 RepID=UPI002B1E5BC1|nr:threonine-phosphate decarboxylase CobD [Halostella sp. PRR32]